MNRPGASGALALSTLALAISFACWGMITLLAKTFQAELGLTKAQVWTLIAVPVLLGSLGRLQWECWPTVPQPARFRAPADRDGHLGLPGDLRALLSGAGPRVRA